MVRLVSFDLLVTGTACATSTIASDRRAETRQRWRFTIDDDHVLTAAMRLELHDGARWRSSDRVCDTYAYTDEWLLLGDLDRALDDEPTPALVVDAR